MLVPMWEDLRIPDFLHLLATEVDFMVFLDFGFSDFPPVDQDGSDIVHPLSSFLVGFGL